MSQNMKYMYLMHELKDLSPINHCLRSTAKVTLI